jgi:hypothetical protein
MAIPSSCSSLPDSQLVNTPAAMLDRSRSYEEIEITIVAAHLLEGV